MAVVFSTDNQAGNEGSILPISFFCPPYGRTWHGRHVKCSSLAVRRWDQPAGRAESERAPPSYSSPAPPERPPAKPQKFPVNVDTAFPAPFPRARPASRSRRRRPNVQTSIVRPSPRLTNYEADATRLERRLTSHGSRGIGFFGGLVSQRPAGAKLLLQVIVRGRGLGPDRQPARREWWGAIDKGRQTESQSRR